MKISQSVYTAEFYRRTLASSYMSAKRIVPLVLELAPFRSVLDVGCGTGGFLRAFLEANIADIVGVDGEWVPRDQLLVDRRLFHAIDLSSAFRLNRRFDLVLSLEVAEHLQPDCADSFVASLTRHGSVILFSAAIPNQGGSGHVNEQWPTYWAQKFAQRGYEVYDLVRPRIWEDDAIAWWYRQNLLIFANADARNSYSFLDGRQPTPYEMLNCLHPGFFTSQTPGDEQAAARVERFNEIVVHRMLFESAPAAGASPTTDSRRK